MKAVQVPENKEVCPVNLIPEIEPNAGKKVNGVMAVPEMKGEAGFCCPEIPLDKLQVQQEWTCAMCQVTTTSETTLNYHLQGRRHRDTLEELMKAKNQLPKGKVSYARNSHLQESASSVACNTSNTRKSNVVKDKPKKLSVPNNLSRNQEVKSQKKVGKKPQFRCTICNIYCSGSEDLNNHLWGKKHLARIQELNTLA
ncbi:uncharacterized protein LOC120184461 isoform X1 [Hibiscus syriacus]|nr:uncharacterized protein LOC120184461 isoform X1 [Hibiscus syriacus]